MKRPQLSNRIRPFLYVVLAAAGLTVMLTGAQSRVLKPIAYTSDRRVRIPDYSKWIFVGSSLGMSYTGQAAENPPFTNVFVEPAAWDEYMKNGVWPDRTILVAERRASVTNLSINKSGFAQTGGPLGAPEIEIKDRSRGGWTFYEARKGETIARPLPKSEVCYSCHEQHAAVDNTFVQFYPSLIEVARRKGTYKESR